MMAGRWDFVAASLTITKARCAQVLFCDPLVYDGDVIVALKDTQPAPKAPRFRLGEDRRGCRLPG